MRTGREGIDRSRLWRLFLILTSLLEYSFQRSLHDHWLPSQHSGLSSNVTGLPRWLSGKRIHFPMPETRGHVFDPWVGRIPGVRNGNSPQYSCLENYMDRGAWLATVQGVSKSQTQLSICVHAKLFQSCPTLGDPMDYSQPGSFVHGILEARILE